jgi:hypothetical protein
VKEEAKTGAPINFLKLQRLWGKERIEQMNADKNGGGHFNGHRNSNDISNSTTISEYIISNMHANKLIYCRFGEKYLQDIEKRKNSMLTE